MTAVVAAQPADSSAAPQPLGGFWRRLAAWILDWWLIALGWMAINLIVSAATNGLGGWLVTALELVLALAYFTFLWGARGQTLGYMLLRLQVARTDGAPVGYGRALLRAALILLTLALALVPAFVSLFTVAFGRRRLALHDLVVRTRVIRV